MVKSAQHRHLHLRAHWHPQAFFAQGNEWQERLLLLNRPWEEDLQHRSASGKIHGTHKPAASGKHSVTSTGWCPGSHGAESGKATAGPVQRR